MLVTARVSQVEPPTLRASWALSVARVRSDRPGRPVPALSTAPQVVGLAFDPRSPGAYHLAADDHEVIGEQQPLPRHHVGRCPSKG
jgi:hypothetical protein